MKLFLSSLITHFYFRIVFSKNAFIVIDLDWPENYLQSIISKTNPNYLIYDKFASQKFDNLFKSYQTNESKFLELFDLKLLAFTLNSETHDDDLAYVICTSGTSGDPKVIQVFNSCIVPNIKQLWYKILFKYRQLFAYNLVYFHYF